MLVENFISFDKKNCIVLRINYETDFVIYYRSWTKVSKCHLSTNLSQSLLCSTHLLTKFSNPSRQFLFLLYRNLMFLSSADHADDSIQPINSNTTVFCNYHHSGNSVDRRIENIQDGGLQLMHSFKHSSQDQLLHHFLVEDKPLSNIPLLGKEAIEESWRSFCCQGTSGISTKNR